jgi:hypothetical protein
MVHHVCGGDAVVERPVAYSVLREHSGNADNADPHAGPLMRRKQLGRIGVKVRVESARLTANIERDLFFARGRSCEACVAFGLTTPSSTLRDAYHKQGVRPSRPLCDDTSTLL